MGNYPNTRKSAHTVTTNWDPNTVEWDVGSPWKKGGGDFINTPAASNANTAFKVWEDYDVTAAVKSFLNNEKPNHGFILKITKEKEDKGVIYASSEYQKDTKLRPKLTITLTTPTHTINSMNPMTKTNITLKQIGNFYWVNVSKKGKFTINIYNLHGKVIYTRMVQSKQIVKIPIKTSGCYFIRINMNNKTYGSKLINNIPWH